jgi:hypothetical protein
MDNVFKRTSKHTIKRTSKLTSKHRNRRTSKRRNRRRNNRKIKSIAKHFGLDLTIFTHILEDYAKQNDMTIMEALDYIKTQPEIIQNIETIEHHSYLLFLQAHKIIQNNNNTYFPEELYQDFIIHLNTKLSENFSSDKLLKIDDTPINKIKKVEAVVDILSESGFKDDMDLQSVFGDSVFGPGNHSVFGPGLDPGPGPDPVFEEDSGHDSEDGSDYDEEYDSEDASSSDEAYFNEVFDVEDIEDIEDIEEIEEDIEDFMKGSSLIRQVSVGYFNQQSIGNCSYMVLTRLIIKIIEVFYFSLTGQSLASVKISNNRYFQYIFTINNVFIMQYLGTYEKQTRYLTYLTHKYFEPISRSEEDITENDLFVYIFIRFYLFMFILSLTDDLGKIISPDSDLPPPSCSLSYHEACIDPKSLAKRGIDYVSYYNLCNTLINHLFPTHTKAILLNVPEYLINYYTSEQAFQYCASKYPLLSKEEQIRICGISPLKYIPPKIISDFLNPLFNLIISQNPSDKVNTVKMLSYARQSSEIDDNTWLDYNYSDSNIPSFESVEPEEFDDPEPPNSHGHQIYELIKNELLSSKEQVLYLSIFVDTNRIIGFEQRTSCEHSFHAMFILFKNATGDPDNPDIQLSLQNSWGEDLAEQKLTIEQFIEYINNGAIFALNYFQIWSSVKNVDKWNVTRLQGGLKKNKTKKRLSSLSSYKILRRQNKRNIKKSR